MVYLAPGFSVPVAGWLPRTRSPLGALPNRPLESPGWNHRVGITGLESPGWNHALAAPLFLSGWFSRGGARFCLCHWGCSFAACPAASRTSAGIDSDQILQLAIDAPSGY